MLKDKILGFYELIYNNRYKVLMLNHEVKHLYYRNNPLSLK